MSFVETKYQEFVSRFSSNKDSGGVGNASTKPAPALPMPAAPPKHSPLAEDLEPAGFVATLEIPKKISPAPRAATSPPVAEMPPTPKQNPEMDRIVAVARREIRSRHSKTPTISVTNQATPSIFSKKS